MARAFDFSVLVNQSTCDKVIGSVEYPFTAVDRTTPFDCSEHLPNGAFYKYSAGEVKALLGEAATLPAELAGNNSPVSKLQLIGKSILQNVERAIKSYKEAPSGDSAATLKQLKSIATGGISQLPDTIKPFGDIQLFAWCSYLKIVINVKPQLTLNSPIVDLSNVELEVTATGEMWAKWPEVECDWHGFPHCYMVVRCGMTGSTTVTVKVKAGLYAEFRADEAKVFAKPTFTQLRLDYPILKEIPLEQVANLALSLARTEAVFDASKLVATLPKLETDFVVAEIELPATSGGLEIDITMKQKLPTAPHMAVAADEG